MNRLGLLSDTHLTSKGSRGIPDVLMRAFQGVDAILHGGDVVDVDCLAPLTQLAPLYVVAGNNDPDDFGLRYGWRRALRWQGWRIGLVHGDQGPGRSTPERARNAFRQTPPAWEEIRSRPAAALSPLPDTHVPIPDGRPDTLSLAEAGGGPFDCILFGHSHIPFCKVMDGVLMVNPGSPTDRRREPRASFAVMEADESRLQIRFFYL